MPEQEKTHGHDSTATDKKDATDPAKGLLRWTLIVGAVGLLILFIVSVYHPYLTERVKFLVGSILSLFVLLAVIVQAVIYRGQWNAMQGQLQAMKEQTEYAQRAYVCIPAGNMKPFEELSTRNQFFAFDLMIANTGNSPANNVRVVIFSDVAESIPDPSLLVLGKPSHRVGVIAPKSHTKQWVKAPNLSSEQNQRWVSSEIEVYCAGLVTYESFGKTRTTKFCFLRRVGSVELESYGRWSEAD